jgi:UDP-glucose:tetrahydrobiopterin glucosyltransferase
MVPAGSLQWRGFLDTDRFQAELGHCQVFLNTPKWNEAFGNVVVEAMACGVPIATYARGGPGELVVEGRNGSLANPDDLDSLAAAVARAGLLDRGQCRRWSETHHSQPVFIDKIETWLQQVLTLSC